MANVNIESDGLVTYADGASKGQAVKDSSGLTAGFKNHMDAITWAEANGHTVMNKPRSMEASEVIRVEIQSTPFGTTMQYLNGPYALQLVRDENGLTGFRDALQASMYAEAHGMKVTSTVNHELRSSGSPMPNSQNMAKVGEPLGIKSIAAVLPLMDEPLKREEQRKRAVRVANDLLNIHNVPNLYELRTSLQAWINDYDNRTGNVPGALAESTRGLLERLNKVL